MVNDKLEQFVTQNSDRFDDLEPSAILWKGIEKIEAQPEVKKYTIQPIKWIVRIAAAIIIFVGSYYFHDYRSGLNQIRRSKSIANENIQLYKTFIEAEYYYTAQIGIETENFYRLAAGNSILREEIQTELQELDTEFEELKNDLKDNADNEEIIAAMIRNYRLKLSILQDMMTQLQQVKKENHNNNETNLIQI